MTQRLLAPVRRHGGRPGPRARDRARRGRVPLGRPRAGATSTARRASGTPTSGTAARRWPRRSRSSCARSRPSRRSATSPTRRRSSSSSASCELSPMTDPRVFLCLGGGDAIDTAAKLARQYWAAVGPARAHPPDQPHVRLPRHARLRHEPRRHGVDAAGLRPAARLGLARRPPVARGARGRDRARRRRRTSPRSSASR